jgi:tetratricopeptide (TPR) repeat protein
MYEQARKAAPDRPENHLNEARLALHGQDLDASFQHLEQVAAAGTEADRMLPCVLELLDARPHHAGALRLLVDVHESGGDQAPARDACIRLAGACMEQGDLHAAAAALERLIRMDPENGRHQERLQDVVARIRQQGGTYPAAGEAPASGATAPAEAPPPAEASAPAEAPAAAVPDPPGDLEEGVDVAADIESVLPAEEELDADFIAEHMTEAEVFVKYGLVDRAVDQFRQVVERYPTYLPAHEGLLAIHREAGDRASAAEAYGNIARIHEARGQTEEAEAAYRQAGELSPAGAAPPEPSDAGPPPVEDAVTAEPLQAAVAAAGSTEVPEPPAAATVDNAIPSGSDPVALPADALEAADALIEGGALGEARRRLDELAGSFPGRSELQSRLRRIDSMEARAQEIEGRELPEGADGLDLFDLAAELDDSLFEAPGMEPEPEPEAEGHSLEDLVAAFKKGVEQEVDADDFETHYNLAIAYREMGLIDEAIGEFQFAAKSPDFFVKCCSMLGFCFREKGMTDLAVKWYSRGIEEGAGDEEELLGLRYDLAALLQEAGEGQRAMELFTEIYGANAKYRDVAERLSSLRGSASGT